MGKDKNFDFTEEVMDGFVMKVPEKCYILKCGCIGEYYNEELDMWLCFEHYHDISDELENGK